MSFTGLPLQPNTSGAKYHQPRLSSRDVMDAAYLAAAVYADTPAELAAYELGSWTVVTDELLNHGLDPSRLVSGLFYSDPTANPDANFPATAEAMLFENTVTGELALSFRGTAGGSPLINGDRDDWSGEGVERHYDGFDDLFSALDPYLQAAGAGSLLVTGHSLGAGMVTLYMQDYADGAVSGVDYRAVSFAAPNASLDGGDSRLLNTGHHNDLVYGLLPGSSLGGNAAKNLFLLTEATLPTPLDTTNQHSMDVSYIYSTEVLLASRFYDQTTRDLRVVVNFTEDEGAMDELARDIINADEAALVLGRHAPITRSDGVTLGVDDYLAGGANVDYLEGFAGDDVLRGDLQEVGSGSPDVLSGGPGADLFLGTPSQLHMDTIVDLEIGDRIGIEDPLFALDIDASDITITADQISIRTRDPLIGPDQVTVINAEMPTGASLSIRNEALAGGGTVLEVCAGVVETHDVATPSATMIEWYHSLGLTGDFAIRPIGGTASNKVFIDTFAVPDDLDLSGSVTVSFDSGQTYGSYVATDEYWVGVADNVSEAAGWDGFSITAEIDERFQRYTTYDITLTGADLARHVAAGVFDIVMHDDTQVLQTRLTYCPLTTDIVGTDGDDQLMGGDGGDDIAGEDGDDTVFGGDGADGLYGGDDEDSVYGGEGEDVISGGSGDDLLIGGARNDTIYGGGGDDAIEGQAGVDALYGGDDRDIINAGSGRDVSVYGGAGADTIYGEGGIDSLRGDDGDDRLFGGALFDWLYGGAGRDTLEGDEGRDRLYGGDDTDVLKGEAGKDWLYGDAQSDTLFGGGGSDSLFGGAGGDVLDGGESNDTLEGGAGRDVLYGGLDRDRLFGQGGDDTAYGGVGNDGIYGGIGDDLLYGDAGRDDIFGDDGRDSVFGGAGNDCIRGNEGADVLYGDGGRDTLWGGAGDDQIFGGGLIDRLHGDAGADTLDGALGGGRDFLYGGADADVLIGADNDDLEGGGGADVFRFSTGFRASNIVDFEQGSDLIDLRGVAAVTNFADLSVTDAGADITIRMGVTADILTVNGDPADFDAGDFVFT